MQVDVFAWMPSVGLVRLQPAMGLSNLSLRCQRKGSSRSEVFGRLPDQMIPILILVFMTLTCLRLVLKTVREALKLVQEAWDLWDRYVARKGAPSEEAPSGPEQLSLWE
jgi:hypothetical protein